MVRPQRSVLRVNDPWLRPVTFTVTAPGPGVAEPERRQHMKRCRFRTTIRDRQTNQNVVRGILGVFREYIEIAAVVEHTRVSQFKLRIALAAAMIRLDKPLVGKFGLWILVERLAIGMRRRRVEVEVTFFDIFAVVALRIGEAEQAFLQDRIAPVPKGPCKAESPFAIADAQQTILAPTVGAAAGMVVRKIFPAGPVRGIILAYGTPLPLGKI